MSIRRIQVHQVGCRGYESEFGTEEREKEREREQIERKREALAPENSSTTE